MPSQARHSEEAVNDQYKEEFDRTKLVLQITIIIIVISSLLHVYFITAVQIPPKANVSTRYSRQSNSREVVLQLKQE